ncbi:transposase [Bacillus sp. FJAT-29790]|uniref:IS66 family transposase n=1 Tax=Bacillus sp. FJAT-29790 TaxID=1895002 RepID=UPI00265F4398|nr:transposase [Bacillus sp. FJAT-29790]
MDFSPNRQEKHFKRMEIYLSRQTKDSWLLYGADQWLVILYKRMHEDLLARTILHADETSFQALQMQKEGQTLFAFFYWLLSVKIANNKSSP